MTLSEAQLAPLLQVPLLSIPSEIRHERGNRFVRELRMSLGQHLIGKPGRFRQVVRTSGLRDESEVAENTAHVVHCPLRSGVTDGVGDALALLLG